MCTQRLLHFVLFFLLSDCIFTTPLLLIFCDVAFGHSPGELPLQRPRKLSRPRLEHIVRAWCTGSSRGPRCSWRRIFLSPKRASECPRQRRGRSGFESAWRERQCPALRRLGVHRVMARHCWLRFKAGQGLWTSLLNINFRCLLTFLQHSDLRITLTLRRSSDLFALFSRLQLLLLLAIAFNLCNLGISFHRR